MAENHRGDSMNNIVNYWLITFCILFLSTSLQAQPCHSLKQLHWLLGRWQSILTDVIIAKPWQQLTINENWQQVSPKTFEGKGETFKRNTLVSSEALRLVEMSNEVFYLAKVAYNEFPIPFTLVSCSATHANFENMTHDSPKHIAYRLYDKDRLEVVISDGKGESFTIKFNNITKAQ